MPSRKTIVKHIMKHYSNLVSNDDRGIWAKKRIRFASEKDANAWFIGLMLDQNQPAERAWEGGEHLVNTHFADVENVWDAISQTHLNTLKRICNKGFKGKAYALGVSNPSFPRNLKEAAIRIVEKYDGSVRNVWKYIRATNVNELYDRLREFSGIGDALARMGQFILVRSMGVGGGEESKSLMRIKPDVHVRRVACRTGLCSSELLSVATSELDALNLESPADFDLAVWDIGREYCKPKSPNCSECPIEQVCAKILD